MYKKIKEIRLKTGFTQKQIAERLKIKYQQYARYENGENEMPMRHYIALADFYGVSLDYLCGRDELRSSQSGSEVG